MVHISTTNVTLHRVLQNYVTTFKNLTFRFFLSSNVFAWLSKSCVFDKERNQNLVKSSGKFYPITCQKGTEGGGIHLHSFFNLGDRCDGWSTPPARRFTTGNSSVSTVQEAVWVQNFPDWSKTFHPHRDFISSPKRLAIPTTILGPQGLK